MINTVDYQDKRAKRKKVVILSSKNNNTKLSLHDRINRYNCKSVKGVLANDMKTYNAKLLSQEQNRTEKRVESHHTVW